MGIPVGNLGFCRFFTSSTGKGICFDIFLVPRGATTVDFQSSPSFVSARYLWLDEFKSALCIDLIIDAC